MSGMILCRSEYSKVPYYIEGADINVCSIEEISYFLYHDIYLVGADFFREELFTFIEKNIKEPELAQRLRMLQGKGAQLSELVLTVLRYVDFYTEDEIAELGDLISRLDTQNPLERLKARADNYLQNERYNSAINCYEDIVYGRRDETLGDEFYGGTWNNMGIAYAGLFNYETAHRCFAKAFELGGSDDAMKNAGLAWKLLNGEYGELNEAVKKLPSYEDVSLSDKGQLISGWHEQYLRYIR